MPAKDNEKMHFIKPVVVSSNPALNDFFSGRTWRVVVVEKALWYRVRHETYTLILPTFIVDDGHYCSTYFSNLSAISWLQQLQLEILVSLF